MNLIKLIIENTGLMLLQQHSAGTEVDKVQLKPPCRFQTRSVVQVCVAPDASKEGSDTGCRLRNITCNLKGYFQNTAL